MDGATWGWIGGIAGGVVGVVGGLVGGWASIRAARPGPLRRFMIRVVAAFWAGIGLAGTLIVLSAAGLLPGWVTWATQGVFFVALGPAIWLINHKARRLEDAGDCTDLR